MLNGLKCGPRQYEKERCELIDAGSCESSVSRAARDVDVLDRLASAARASLMRVTVALERALMPALTYASVQKDVLLAVVSAA